MAKQGPGHREMWYTSSTDVHAARPRSPAEGSQSEALACAPGDLGTHCRRLPCRTPPRTLQGQRSTRDNLAGRPYPSLELLLPPDHEWASPEAFPLRGSDFLLNCSQGRRKRFSPIPTLS